jgi:hypothetical protein
MWSAVWSFEKTD